MLRRIVLTSGDVNGIGPEIGIKTISEKLNGGNFKVIFVIPRNVFEKYYNEIKASFPYKYEKDISDDSNIVSIVDIPDVPMNIGLPTSESGKASYQSILTALSILKENPKNSLLITAPISKTAFELAGIDFPGHTELLAEYFHIRNYAMLFLSEFFNAALATIHVPLSKVAEYLTVEYLEEFLPFVLEVVRKDLGIAHPRIAVLGINPHAGENGRIGKEENEIIKPVVEKMPNVFGPFVPDAFFATKKYKEFDIVIGMYHDQVLIPFKMLALNKGVNFTAGLPIVRTSPDHGTAYDIAGKLIADAGSMSAAWEYGIRILNKRLKNAD